jgi:mannitol 2-dehydrogenase
MSEIILNQENILALATRLDCPTYDRKNIRKGIIHIGVGGFHRSHKAYYMHQLLRDVQYSDYGICGIGLREGDKHIANVFKNQDCLYTLITQHPDGRETCEVIGSIVDYIYAPESKEIAINRMAHPETKIVSLTITEGGYNFNPTTGEFDFSNSDVQHDLAHPHDPNTVFGFLAAALKIRRDQDLPAFTILSCDNIQHNGDMTRKMLLSFVQRQDQELYEWIKNEVCFPNCMVDRITPVTPQSSIEYLKEKYQLLDSSPVVCEPYIQWVIEDKFSNGRPPLEKLGVQFVPDVTPYEEMKIRLLNAGHSVLGIPGAIYGHKTIDACMEDKIFATFMREFMDYEVTPRLGNIEGIDITEYKDSLEERFANPNIKDGVSRICSESSAKLPKFLIPTIQDNLSAGESIKYGTFILATWAYYSDKRKDANGIPLEIIDVRKEELHDRAKKYEQDPLSFLGISDIFGSLVEDERFVNQYLKTIKAIYQDPDIHKMMTSITTNQL